MQQKESLTWDAGLLVTNEGDGDNKSRGARHGSRTRAGRRVLPLRVLDSPPTPPHSLKGNYSFTARLTLLSSSSVKRKILIWLKTVCS